MPLPDLYLPLLPPPPPPADPSTPRYAGYDGAFAASDGGDALLAIDALQAGTLPGTDTVVTPQAGTVKLLRRDGGAKLPDGTPVTADTVQLRVGPNELTAYQSALPGRPAPVLWAFTGIDAASFATQVEQWAGPPPSRSWTPPSRRARPTTSGPPSRTSFCRGRAISSRGSRAAPRSATSIRASASACGSTTARTASCTRRSSCRTSTTRTRRSPAIR